VRNVEREEAMEMAAVGLRTRPLHLSVVEDQDPHEVVAVVLADGTVRDLHEAGTPREGGWAKGSISGPDWVLWWERRSFTGE
jgi:hypothetical protein